MFERLGGALIGAGVAALKLILIVAFAVAAFTYATTHPETFTQVVNAVFNAAAEIIVSICQWITAHLGSSTAG